MIAGRLWAVTKFGLQACSRFLITEPAIPDGARILRSGGQRTPAPMQITAREPFDFERTLRFVLSPPALLNGRLFEPLLDHFESDEYRRAADLNGQPVLYGVSVVKPSTKRTGRRARPALAGTSLDLRILAGPQNEVTKHALAELVERQFSTSLDLAPFYRLAASEHVLTRI